MRTRQAVELAMQSRAALLEYATEFTDDPQEAAERVAAALVAVLARRGSGTEIAAWAQVEIRRSFGLAARRSGRSRWRPPRGAGGDLTALVGAVRRRRFARGGLVAGTVVAALVLLAGAGYGVERLWPAVPQVQAVPTVVATSAAPPEPTAPQTYGPITEPGIPAADPLVEGMIESAGPGWSIVQYVQGRSPATHFYLVSPAGDRYGIPTPLQTRADLWLADWLPGTRLVLMGSYSPDTHWDVLDVLTGERYLTVNTRPDEPDEDSVLSVGFVGDETTDVIAGWNLGGSWTPDAVSSVARIALGGQVVAEISEFRGSDLVERSDWVLSPGGSQLAVNERGRLRVLDAADFTEVAEIPSPHPDRPGACEIQQWWSSDQLQLRCDVSDGDQQREEAWLAPLRGGSATLLYTTDYLAMAWPVADLALVRDVYGEAEHIVAIEDGAARELDVELPGAITAVAGGRLYGLNPPYEWVLGERPLVVVDVAAGTTETLFPIRSDDEGIRSVVTHSDEDVEPIDGMAPWEWGYYW